MVIYAQTNFCDNPLTLDLPESKDIQTLQAEFVDWVEKFEMYDRVYTPLLRYVKFSKLASKLRAPFGHCGPFPWNTFAGDYNQQLKANNTRIHLMHIALIYNIAEELLPQKPPGDSGQFSHPQYLSCVLLLPCHKGRFDLAQHVEQWGKVRHLENRDTMVAAALTKAHGDMQDATFVRFEALVDKYPHQRKCTPLYKKKTFFGQLHHIIVLAEPTIIIFAAIKPFLDITYVQCVVGRVPADSRWALIDRSGSIAHTVYEGNSD
ncbi:hypothetical protein SERLA73DRAFT_149375 [Serpula lacrymans var. lacrymans S7.3]|uniref:Uncharacterized protein n=1 Tax=Serpula lacrymans var. lacrymans (strain S7.3) TaxID=936435 RepID=F8PIA8_SERL3|nr:hypothetical protein SERLA73DRAFT_149375 [Serpula lacrymans var. lacrymans S7.3]